jgi:DNA-binding MarR family transcriptional regulator
MNDTPTIEDVPPSAKLVYKVLEHDAPQTQRQLTEETLLPSRTVRYALSRLDEVDLVETRFSFTDSRNRLYSPVA